MVTKKSNKNRVKVGKLDVNKETVKDLGEDEARKVRGGHHVTIAEQCYTSGFCDKDSACKRPKKIDA